MQQVFRRQLLALGSLAGTTESVDRSCQQFIQSVLATAIEKRPDSDGVMDVLRSNGVLSAVVARFVNTFNRAVWNMD